MLTTLSWPCCCPCPDVVPRMLRQVSTEHSVPREVYSLHPKWIQAILCFPCKVTVPGAETAPVRRDHLIGKMEQQQQLPGACCGCRVPPRWESLSWGLWPEVTVKTSSQSHQTMPGSDSIMHKNTITCTPAGTSWWAGRSRQGGGGTTVACWGWHPRLLLAWSLWLESQPLFLGLIPGHRPPQVKLLSLQDPPCSPTSQHKIFWGKSEWMCMSPCPVAATSATEASINEEQRWPEKQCDCFTLKLSLDWVATFVHTSH